MKNKRKASKERRVLVAALLVGAMILTGSTFAWLTSKDEVTNRLSASAEYSVAIAESFQAPENWIPGQEINKDASAVNTGNVDAFVRMWLTGNMRLLKQTNEGTAVASLGTPTDVTDANLLGMGLTKTNGNGLYYKTLDKTQTINPNAAASGDQYGFGGQMSGPYSEVQAMQGSRLAYAPENAKYAYVLKEETVLPIYVSKDGATAVYEEVAVPAGTMVYVNAATPVAATITSGTFAPAAGITITPSSGAAYTSTGTVYVASTNLSSAIKNVEYESFTPFTDGLYLFLRNEADTEVEAADLEYSGYYVTGLADNNASNGTFYALNTNTDGTNRSNYTVKSVAGDGTATVAAPVKTTIVDGVINNVVPDTAVLQVYTADYGTVLATELKWFYDATNKKIYAVYDKDNNNAFAPASGDSEDIVIEITLANVGTDAQNWTPIGSSSATNNYNLAGTTLSATADKLTFYYNDDVEAGDSSAKLVDKVKLYEGVTNKAYLAFDFDLNVNLESIQVTYDENGNEQATAVAPWSNNTESTNSGATGTATVSGKEITSISWS